LWASQDYLDKNGILEKPEDLNDHRLLTFGEETMNVYANLNWILEVGVSLDYRRTPYLKINSLEGLTNLAKSGIGIVELPEEYVNLKNANLISVLPDIPSPQYDLYYIYPERMKKSKRVTSLGDYLEEQLSKQ
jgi:DNA-binding transcriptional LysR family regulator